MSSQQCCEEMFEASCCLRPFFPTFLLFRGAPGVCNISSPVFQRLSYISLHTRRTKWTEFYFQVSHFSVIRRKHAYKHGSSEVKFLFPALFFVMFFFLICLLFSFLSFGFNCCVRMMYQRYTTGTSTRLLWKNLARATINYWNTNDHEKVIMNWIFSIQIWYHNSFQDPHQWSHQMLPGEDWGIYHEGTRIYRYQGCEQLWLNTD